MSVNAEQGRAESGAIGQVARRAAARLIYFFSRLLHGFARRSPREPAFIFIRFLNDDRTDHPRVKGAAILSAKQVKRPHLRSLKPKRREAPRQDVFLDAERRNK